MITSTTILLGFIGRLAELGLLQPFSLGGYPKNGSLPAPFLEELPALPESAASFAVTGYLDDRDPYNPDVYVRVRFREPGQDVRRVNDRADAVYAAVHSTEPTAGRQLWPGGLLVQSCFRQSRGATTRDTTTRFVRPDTYRITLHTGSGV